MVDVRLLFCNYGYVFKQTEPTMTNDTQQQKAFYQRTGLSFLGFSFERAMQTPALRIAITCGAKASNKGKPAPVQPGLI
jgi:hypothetical protein